MELSPYFYSYFCTLAVSPCLAVPTYHFRSKKLARRASGAGRIVSCRPKDLASLTRPAAMWGPWLG